MPQLKNTVHACNSLLVSAKGLSEYTLDPIAFDGPTLDSFGDNQTYPAIIAIGGFHIEPQKRSIEYGPASQHHPEFDSLSQSLLLGQRVSVWLSEQ